MTKTKTLQATLALTFIATLTLAQDASAILEKYFERIGGIERLNSIQASSIKYHSINFLPKVDTSYFVTISKLPHFSRSEYYAPGKVTATSETFQNEKENVTRFYDMGMEHKGKLHTPTLSTPHHLLAIYRTKGFKKSKNETVSGKPCYGIVSKHKPPSVNSVYYFDQSTGDLVASSREDLENDITYYLDQRSINGVIVPFATEYFLNDQLINKVIYKSIEFGVDVDEKIFYARNWKSKRDKSSKYNRVEFFDQSKTDGSLPDFINHFSGQRILVDLWATWCTPCKMEFNTYDSTFYEFLAQHQVKMIFLSIDRPEKEEQWKRDIETYNINGYHAIASKKLTKSISQLIYEGATMYIPRYFLIDEKGNILSKEIRKPSSGKAFQSQIQTLLKK